MNYPFYVFSAKKIKRIFVFATVILFAAGIIYIKNDNVTVFSPENNPFAIYSVPTDKKIVALTFDISWGDTQAENVLKVLQENKVEKATFFLSSPWSSTHRHLVQKIDGAGYEIGSHGHKHDNYSGMSDDEVRKQIQTAHHILTDITGKAPNLIRMPNGDFNKRVLQIANNLGYKVIQSGTDSGDWKNPGVDMIVNRVVNKAHPGDIILMHASDTCKQTHLALPAILEHLSAKGYRFVTVSELIQQTEMRSKMIQDQSAWQ